MRSEVEGGRRERFFVSTDGVMGVRTPALLCLTISVNIPAIERNSVLDLMAKRTRWEVSGRWRAGDRQRISDQAARIRRERNAS